MVAKTKQYVLNKRQWAMNKAFTMKSKRRSNNRVSECDWKYNKMSAFIHIRETYKTIRTYIYRTWEEIKDGDLEKHLNKIWKVENRLYVHIWFGSSGKPMPYILVYVFPMRVSQAKCDAKIVKAQNSHCIFYSILLKKKAFFMTDY